MTPRVRCLGCGDAGRWGRPGRCPSCRRHVVARQESNPRRRTHKALRYNAEHRALRRALEPIVATGAVHCARCHDPILPGQPWDLDHLDDGTSAPSHAAHNRAARRTTRK